MSRHRHVRNLRLDDYQDDDDYYDDPHYEEDSTADHDTAQYLWNPTSTQPEPPPPPPQDDLLSDLTAQFRTLLNDASLQESDIDAAIVSCNYDVDAALDLLRSRFESVADAPNLELQRLENNSPSPIGRMVDETEDSPPQLPMPAGNAQWDTCVHVDSGNTILPSRDSTAIVPFAFDQPSPDDIIKQKQGAGGARARALRMPKASYFKTSANDNAKSRQTRSAKVAEKVPADQGKGRMSGSGARVEDKPSAKRERGAAARAPSQQVVRDIKQRQKPVDLSERIASGCNSVSVVVAGHVDAGKSTLLGHLLKLLGGETTIGKRRGRKKAEEMDLAWGTDVDAAERERGVTIDIATRVFQRGGRSYAMIDAPGHRDFVPAMIVGACQASGGMLVIDGSRGEFEAGFSEGGQTREHAVVLRSLGVEGLVCVVNKLDCVDYDKRRYEEIVRKMRDYLRGNGWKMNKVEFVAAGGREGVNLVARAPQGHPLAAWYEGKTVVEGLEQLGGVGKETVEKMSMKATRLIVSEQFRSERMGGQTAVAGRLISGSIVEKDRLMICPGWTMGTVKWVTVGKDERVDVAVAGVDMLPVSVGLADMSTEVARIGVGSVLCDAERKVKVGLEFRARVVTLTTGVPLIQGTRGVVHIGGGMEAAAIVKLVSFGGGKKRGKRPRRLIKGDAAVVEIRCDRGVAMEKFEDERGLGRFALRQAGKTVAVGVVLEVLKEETGSGGGGVENGKE
eukprot:GFKZ01013110.1.p1 GENE.GFKZ01013110.1~~GFKZ01013110.1.p1  ORF type:complete len:747 (-),score=125.92 GFKZ01013110.1:1283-3484(-)